VRAPWNEPDSQSATRPLLNGRSSRGVSRPPGEGGGGHRRDEPESPATTAPTRGSSSLDGFIHWRAGGRRMDGVGADVSLVGGWGADEIRPSRPFTPAFSCRLNVGPVLCRPRTALVLALLSETFPQAQPSVQFSERSQPRKNRA
jgi:hypothetical protein